MASLPPRSSQGCSVGLSSRWLPMFTPSCPSSHCIAERNTRAHYLQLRPQLFLSALILPSFDDGVHDPHTYASPPHNRSTTWLTCPYPGEPPSHRQRTRSKSPRSRPTTPLRPSSRSSLRDSVQRGRGAAASGNALEGLQDGFAELSDAMADLEQNFMQLQLMHESLARFSESFAGFLYGMNMNAFCVDFPEVCGDLCTAQGRKSV
jgi:hypothetical protein